MIAIQQALAHLLGKQQDKDTVNEVFSRFCLDDSKPNGRSCEDSSASVDFMTDERGEIDGILTITDEEGTETRHGFRVLVQEWPADGYPG